MWISPLKSAINIILYAFEKAELCSVQRAADCLSLLQVEPQMFYNINFCFSGQVGFRSGFGLGKTRDQTPFSEERTAG